MDASQPLVGLGWLSYETASGKDLFLEELLDLGTYVAESFQDMMVRVSQGSATANEVKHITQPKKYRRIWELRYKHDHSIYRVYFALVGKDPTKVLALHAIKKKSSKKKKTQDYVFETAAKRLADWELRNNLK